MGTGSRRGRLSCRSLGQCRVHSLLPSLAGGEEAAVAFTWVHTTGLCRALGPRGRPGEAWGGRLLQAGALLVGWRWWWWGPALVSAAPGARAHVRRVASSVSVDSMIVSLCI